MKPASSWIPASATALLHAGLIALAITGLHSGHKIITPPKPVSVLLLHEQPKPPAPVAPPVAAPAEPLSQPRHKERPPKPHAAPKPTPQVREQDVAPADAPAPAATMPPASNAAALPAPARAGSAAPSPSASASPVKHGIFVDPSYVAAETEKWYPRQSKRYGDQGTVLLHITVSATGRAEKVELRRGSGYPLLDSAAVELAQSLTYRPATLDGKPVSDSFNMPVTFKLND